MVDSDVVRTEEGNQALAGTSLVDSDTLSTNERVHDAIGASEVDNSVPQTSQIENNVMGRRKLEMKPEGCEEMSQQDCAGGRRKSRKERHRKIKKKEI